MEKPNSAVNTSKPLHIAVLIRNFVTTGGAERYAVEVTRRMAKEHRISVLCQTWDPELTDGLEIVQIPRLCVKPSWLNCILFAWSAHRAVLNGNYDLVHSHERTFHFDALVVHCPCYKTKFVERGSRGLWTYLWRQFLSLRHATYAWLERQQFKVHSRRQLVVVSDYVARNIKMCYPDGNHNFVVAPPGVEMPQLTCSAPREDQRFEVLFVGTEFKRKGLEHAIRGFAAATNQNARLRIAGGGDPAVYQKLARELGIGDRVEFLGLVKDVGELYLSSHVFLFPTLIEPFGMSPLEAMSYGLPVIVSGPDCNGFVEQVRNDEAIVLEDVQNHKAIGQALDALTRVPNWQQHSLSSLQAAKRLSWEHSAQQNLVALKNSKAHYQP